MATKNPIVQQIADRFHLEYRVDGQGYTRHVLTREIRVGSKYGHVQARFLGQANTYCRASIFANSIKTGAIDVGRGDLELKATKIAEYLIGTSPVLELQNKYLALNHRLNELAKEATEMARKRSHIQEEIKRIRAAEEAA